MSRAIVEGWYEANHIANRRQKLRQVGRPKAATSYGQLSYRRPTRHSTRAEIQLREHVAFVVAIAIIILGAGIAGGGVTGI